MFGVFKIINRNNDEWRDKEQRFQIMEQEMVVIRGEGRQVIALGTEFTSMKDELKRVRDRLDQFLDRQVVTS